MCNAGAANGGLLLHTLSVPASMNMAVDQRISRGLFVHGDNTPVGFPLQKRVFA